MNYWIQIDEKINENNDEEVLMTYMCKRLEDLTLFMKYNFQ
jgi:hypothetical protein